MRLLMTKIYPVPADLVQLDDIENIADIEYDEISRKMGCMKKYQLFFYKKFSK